MPKREYATWNDLGSTSLNPYVTVGSNRLHEVSCKNVTTLSMIYLSLIKICTLIWNKLVEGNISKELGLHGNSLRLNPVREAMLYDEGEASQSPEIYTRLE